ncbi:uncharacterized protein si:ch211-191i18.2 [Pseudoliparis swirei]|uniref:uncharacterized protein si:ch211-191i18.2 n=1 Tax=Pseudoliparis swirei TaxID=2059687 RepID=UPI0024BEA24D|nr:uncharacterized protein si:ch211-191i18.2 [Pseudoliparis swirei]
MFIWSLVSLCLSTSTTLLLPGAEAQYYDSTPPPDGEDDFNGTFEYSFYSNTSSEELDKFSEPFIDEEEEEEAVTMTTIHGPTERNRVHQRSAASLPVPLEIRTLVWTLMILMSLNMQQLQHTL